MDIESLPPHPNPQPQPHHRKIELQSIHDLTYLQDNLAKSALAKLDLHFPPIPPQPEPATVIPLGKASTEVTGNGGAASTQQQSQAQKQKQDDAAGGQNGQNVDEDDNDPFRTRVRHLLTEYLTHTWQNAQSNLSINGLDVSSLPIPHTATLSKPHDPASDSQSQANDNNKTPNANPEPKPEREGVDFTYTAFDPKLQHKLASLHGELEKLTAEVSKLRRTAPQQGSAKYQSKLDATLSRDEELYTRSLTTPSHDNAQNDNDNDNDMDLDDDTIQEEVGGDRKGRRSTLSKGKRKRNDPQPSSSSSAASKHRQSQPEKLGLGLNPVRRDWSNDLKETYEHGIRELNGLAGLQQQQSSSTATNTKNDNEYDEVKFSSSGSGSGTENQTMRTTKMTSLTETMGKIKRAGDVVMEME